MHPFDPLTGGGLHGAGPGWAGGPPPFAPFLGGLMFLLFLIVVITMIGLVRRGRFGPPPWLRQPGPEREARRILAERFARSEIDSDEFMERASVLNWTPGVEPVPVPRQRRHRR